MKRRLPTVPLAAALIAMSLLTPGVSAQRVSFGVVVGGYANRDFDSQYASTPGFLPRIVQSGSGGYIVGPSFDVRLFPHLSLGVEALYKPLHYDEAASYRNGVVIGFAPATVVTWQFPVLAKYKFPLRRVKPFLEAGPSFRAAGNLNSSNPSHFGISAGLGVEAQWRRLNIAPRLRYTRWAKDPWFAGVPTRADQLEFLVGIGYAATSDAHPLGRRISLGVVL
ncbi:MAG: PorT family protein, partial [Planctomycetaceae bacterium]